MSKLTFEKLVYRLLFTRDDDMDLLQVMFLINIVFFFTAFGLVGSGRWAIPDNAWNVFKWVFTVLALAGTPTSVANLILRFSTGGAASALSTPGAADADATGKEGDKG